MDSDGDGEDDPLNCVRPVLSQAKLQATHVARSCKAAIGKALRERASQDNFMRETETSTALDVSCRMIFFSNMFEKGIRGETHGDFKEMNTNRTAKPPTRFCFT